MRARWLLTATLTVVCLAADGRATPPPTREAIIAFLARGSDRDLVAAFGDDWRGLALRGLRLRDVRLSGADLSGSDLREAVLDDVDLSRCRLSQTRLDGARLTRVDLSRADLRQAVVEGARFDRCVFAGACLAGLDLRTAELKRPDLSDANLHGVRLRAAALTGARVRRAQLDDQTARDLPAAAREELIRRVQGRPKEPTRSPAPPYPTWWELRPTLPAPLWLPLLAVVLGFCALGRRADGEGTRVSVGVLGCGLHALGTTLIIAVRLQYGHGASPLSDDLLGLFMLLGGVPALLLNPVPPLISGVLFVMAVGELFSSPRRGILAELGFHAFAVVAMGSLWWG